MSWQSIWDHYLNLAPGVWEISLRLGCAMLVGLIIGIEREYTHRPAGMRTHILVALGACVVSIAGEMLFTQYNTTGATPDPARLSAQVITGVGFLGAGTIMKEGPTVKGLTTAASLWAVACLGIAAGGGYYEVALIGMVLMYITLTLLEVFQNLLLKGAKRHNKDFTITVEDVSAGINAINLHASSNSCKVSNISIETTDSGAQISFHTEFGSGGRKKRQQRFLDALAATPGILSVKQTHETVSV